MLPVWCGDDGLGRKGIVVIGSGVSKGNSAEPFWVGMEGMTQRAIGYDGSFGWLCLIV